MRNQDGGAHLDDHIKDKTYLTVQIHGVGFQYKPNEALPQTDEACILSIT
jgi:hypothetical protein